MCESNRAIRTRGERTRTPRPPRAPRAAGAPERPGATYKIQEMRPGPGLHPDIDPPAGIRSRVAGPSAVTSENRPLSAPPAPAAPLSLSELPVVQRLRDAVNAIKAEEASLPPGRGGQQARRLFRKEAMERLAKAVNRPLPEGRQGRFLPAELTAARTMLRQLVRELGIELTLPAFLEKDDE